MKDSHLCSALAQQHPYRLDLAIDDLVEKSIKTRYDVSTSEYHARDRQARRRPRRALRARPKPTE